MIGLQIGPERKIPDAETIRRAGPGRSAEPAGLLAPVTGDRLPPERDLALRLGCSRETLRKALDALENDGTIWRHAGQGTFRGRRPRHLPVRDTLLVEGATPPDLMRARLVLEPQVAAEAALRADAADIGHLRDRVTAGGAAYTAPPANRPTTPFTGRLPA